MDAAARLRRDHYLTEPHQPNSDAQFAAPLL